MKNIKSKRVGFITWFLFFLLIFFLGMPASAETALLKKISVTRNPPEMRLYVTERTPFKIIGIEKKELLIALKNISTDNGFSVTGNGKDLFKSVEVEKLRGNVLAVVITGKGELGKVDSMFDNTDSSFVIRLDGKSLTRTAEKKKKTPQTEKPETAKPAEKPEPIPRTAETLESEPAVESGPVSRDEPEPEPAARSAEKEETAAKKAKPEKETVSTPSPEPKQPEKETNDGFTPPDRPTSPYNGDVSDLLKTVKLDACGSEELEKALALTKNGMYDRALDILAVYIDTGSGRCLEQASYLRAYAFFKNTETGKYDQLIKAEQLFQDALISFPSSSLKPFGLSAMGLIHMRMNNPAVAEGYFTIVEEGYGDYPGMPEVLFYLAGIFTDEGYEEKGLRYFRRVFENHPQNTYTVDAGLGLGKALYNIRHYLDALHLFDHIAETSPGKIYESSELLLNIGKAALKLGKSGKARESLMRAINLFPDIESRDMILSDIGDTYAMENRLEKAKTMYRYVRENFPDTEGFIKSSMGLARQLEKREEREKIYKMVKTRHPEHKFARVAMMRLAEIYQENREYEKCIEEIEDLLSTHPRALRYEAVHLMQKAYESLFENNLGKGEYTDILKKYEKEYVRIDRMNSKTISLNVGLSYFRAGLYEQAFNHLLGAYKQYDRNARPPELLYAMGTSMDETGRDDDALKLLKGYGERFPQGARRVEALTRIALIHMEKKAWETSGRYYDRAYQASGDHLEKGKVLYDKAMMYKAQKRWGEMSETLTAAVNDIASASGENYGSLFRAYRNLGDAYIEQRLFVKAADSYSKALKFSNTRSQEANLKFMLADAYQKSNALKEAKEIFTEVADRFDSVWGRLAAQRLSTLELAEDVKKS
ncbi:MAG: tetratricopeptide repeat protein [Desulfarculaceae bacterium]|nr:tetratricopeptide repeat protein [Desulfarculaceae bacterium]